MVYLAAGISGLTGIVGTFFVKEYLGLSAEFLASLGFWAMLPWAMKMPMGHLVDLLWRHKGRLIYFGAGLVALSLLIMIGLLAKPAAMREIMSPESWYVLSVLLAPMGYVIQDTVADAMTVEAVPRVDEEGNAIPDEQLKLAHTTMQTLGRVAIIGGTLLVAAVNVFMFSGVENMDIDQKKESTSKSIGWPSSSPPFPSPVSGCPRWSAIVTPGASPPRDSNWTRSKKCRARMSKRRR